MSQLLYPEKIARWALNRKLFGPQIRHKLPFEKLEIADPNQISSTDCLSRNLLAIPTTLSRIER